MALNTMNYVQQSSCDWMAYGDVEEVLQELVHSLLLPYMPDVEISMISVFQIGLPVLMQQLSTSLLPGKFLRDLLVAFMDRLACDPDLGTAAGIAPGSVLMHKLDKLAYGMSRDSGVLAAPMPPSLFFQPSCCRWIARLVPAVFCGPSPLLMLHATCVAHFIGCCTHMSTRGCS